MARESRPVDDRRARHLTAIGRSLAQANEAARAGDFTDALGWLAAVEAVGHELSDEHRSKRDLRQLAARDAPTARQPTT